MHTGKNRTQFIVAGAIAVIAIGAFLAVRMITPSTNTVADTNTTSFTQPTSIENFVTAMISQLSPVKEQVGGKYYVTKIDAHGGKGTANFEDGHNAYVADFTYTIDDKGVPSVSTFTIRS